MATKRIAATWISDDDPTPDDDRASSPPRAVADRWVNPSSGSTWTCTDDTPTSAVWTQEDGSGGGGGGPSPGGTVVDERVLDHQASSAGAAATYSRSDHTHGTPAMPSASDVGAVPTGRTLTGTAPITIAGDNAAHDLSANRTIAVDTATTSAAGVVRLATTSSDTTVGRAVQASDARLSDARTPSGTIGGDLVGSTWPTLTIASTVISAAARTVLDDASVAAMLVTLGGVPTGRLINTTAPLTGGGDLSADRTLAVSTMVASGASHARGVVPDPPASAGTVKFLCEDATWKVLPAVATHTRYDPEAPAAGVTYVTPTDEFATAATNVNFTTTVDPASVTPTKTIGPHGLVVTIPSGGGTTKIAGYSATFPGGGGDFIIAARIHIEGANTSTGSGILALVQGRTTNDDIWGVGMRATTGANEPVAWVGSLTGYTAAATTDRFLSGSGPSSSMYVVIRYGASTQSVTAYIGPEPDCLTIVDPNRALGFAPTDIAILGWGLQAKVRFTVPFLRVAADTFPGATYDFAPRMSGALFSGI